MTRGGTDRRNTCLRAARAIRRSQLGQRLASSIRGTAMRLPFGSTVESWLPRPSACPRPSPYAVPRVDGASRHRSQDQERSCERWHARAALKHSCECRHCASSS